MTFLHLHVTHEAAQVLHTPTDLHLRLLTISSSPPPSLSVQLQGNIHNLILILIHIYIHIETSPVSCLETIFFPLRSCKKNSMNLPTPHNGPSKKQLREEVSRIGDDVLIPFLSLS